MKKIIVLGGKPIGSCEITEATKMRGLYTIVTDFLPPEESAAKRIADAHWEISTADVERLRQRCLDEGVSAAITGVHEFNIKRRIELCEAMSYPQYCTREQWDFCENKAAFKQMCSKHGIPVAKTYHKEDRIDYPVIVKPVDSSGSRGFSICHNEKELCAGIEFALSFSASKAYLIEEYMQCEAGIVHYTAVDGEIIFSGMSDKYSQRLEGGASVMALQLFPSKFQERYLAEVNEKAIRMFQDLGVRNGPIWIETFIDEKTGRFVFNEMGYRFGGSMTNYPVKHFYGIDQIDLLISNAIGEAVRIPNTKDYVPKTAHYCILPVHLKAGTVSSVNGIQEAEAIAGVEKIVLVHFPGDKIQNWGTAQQVFCYLHMSYNTEDELAKTIESVKDILSVLDTDNHEMLFYLFDLAKLGVR